MNPTITLIIQAGFDGGRVIFESVTDEFGHPETRLVFGGDVDQSNKYIADRNAKLDDVKVATEQPRQLEAPAKIRVRRRQESTPADVLDALDMIEGHVS